MANESLRKKNALLDWKNEKKYQEKVLKNPAATTKTKSAARARIKEADTWIKKLSK